MLLWDLHSYYNALVEEIDNLTNSVYVYFRVISVVEAKVT